jgi:hypothetical protein
MVILSETPKSSPSLCEQVFRFLRRKDGGRFVEDEDARLAVERFEDLDALLDPHRKVGDAGARVHPQAVAFGQPLGRPYRLVEVQGDATAGFGA